MEAAAGGGAPPGELWRHTAPYRGLSAMTESDADYFFGRGGETAEVIDALAATPDKLPILLGNSGVGKSSLAQAGVLAALMRQAWPETLEAAGRVAASFQREPPLVLSQAQARHRAGAGVGRAVSLDLAVRRG